MRKVILLPEKYDEKYDVEIRVRVKNDDSSLWRGVTISLPDSTYKRFSSIWPEVLYQAEASRRILEKEIEEEKCKVINS